MAEFAITAVVHRQLCFRDRRGDEQFAPSLSRQRIPAHVASHPYFLAALASEWVTDVRVLNTDTGEEAMPFSEYSKPQKHSGKRKE